MVPLGWLKSEGQGERKRSHLVDAEKDRLEGEGAAWRRKKKQKKKCVTTATPPEPPTEQERGRG